MLYEFFHEVHDVVVIGVGLIQLKHCELWVVARRDSLVAEDPTNLEHFFESRDR